MATGPSLTAHDCSAVSESGHKIIAVNDAYKLLPDAHILYAADYQWWKIHLDQVRKKFNGKLCTQWHKERDKEYPLENGIEAIQGFHTKGLGQHYLSFNGNSGAQAINLAYLLGAKRIILLGYDMSHCDGKSHFFGDHPKPLKTVDHKRFINNFSNLAVDLKSCGVEVINCSRRTALYQFKKMRLEDVLKTEKMTFGEESKEAKKAGISRNDWLKLNSKKPVTRKRKAKSDKQPE